MHVLGVVSGQSTWTSKIVNGKFTGPKAKAANHDSYVPVSSDGGHLAPNVSSVHTPSESDPGHSDTQTAIDWAVLDDIGWSVSELHNSIATAEQQYN